MNYALTLAALFAGLAGFGHCAAMCGGFVTAASRDRSGANFALGYHAGRLASYMTAGALAGGIGSALLLADAFLPVQRALYLVAALMLAALGAYLLGITRFIAPLERAGGVIWQRLAPLVGRVVPPRSTKDAVLAGALWGWVPCGLVYSVLASAAASGSVLAGGVTMFAFGLGTLPALVVGGALARRLPFRRAAGALLIGFAVVGLSEMLGAPPIALLIERCFAR